MGRYFKYIGPQNEGEFMKKKKILIVSASIGDGHMQAASALQEAFVQYGDCHCQAAPAIAGSLYNLMAKTADFAYCRHKGAVSC